MQSHGSLALPFKHWAWINVGLQCWAELGCCRLVWAEWPSWTDTSFSIRGTSFSIRGSWVRSPALQFASCVTHRSLSILWLSSLSILKNDSNSSIQGVLWTIKGWCVWSISCQCVPQNAVCVCWPVILGIMPLLVQHNILSVLGTHITPVPLNLKRSQFSPHPVVKPVSSVMLKICRKYLVEMVAAPTSHLDCRVCAVQ